MVRIGCLQDQPPLPPRFFPFPTTVSSMVDSEQVEVIMIGLSDASKANEWTVADSASSMAAPSPTIDDFPDGGLTAWLIVVGVCALLAKTHTLR